MEGVLIVFTSETRVGSLVMNTRAVYSQVVTELELASVEVIGSSDILRITGVLGAIGRGIWPGDLI